MSKKGQRLELVVKAKSWNDAINVLSKIGVDEKNRIDYRPINGLYIVEVEKDKELTESDYESISDATDIAILSDSISRERIGIVLSKIYEVETQLRKVLLHAYDLIEKFFEVFGSESKYTRDYTEKKSVTRKGSLNPITSHLTLGQAIKIMEFDLSWNHKKVISPQEMYELLKGSSGLKDLKQNLSDKIQEKRVWDVIAENVIKKNVKWDEVNSIFKELKKFRDISAHNQIITNNQKDKLVKKASSLLEILTPAGKTTKKDYSNLADFANDLNVFLNKLESAHKSLTSPVSGFANINANMSDSLYKILNGSLNNSAIVNNFIERDISDIYNNMLYEDAKPKTKKTNKNSDKKE